MTAVVLLFGAFFVMMFAGVPIAASLGLAGTLAIAIGKLGIMAFPTNFYAGIAKYPLLAIPMFVLAGAIFDRAGVASRLLTFAQAIIGRGPRLPGGDHDPRGHDHRGDLRIGARLHRRRGRGDARRHDP